MTTITTPELAKANGLEVPTRLQNLADHILVYNADGDLVAFGPESDREQIMRLAKVYE